MRRVGPGRAGGGAGRVGPGRAGPPVPGPGRGHPGPGPGRCREGGAGYGRMGPWVAGAGRAVSGRAAPGRVGTSGAGGARYYPRSPSHHPACLPNARDTRTAAPAESVGLLSETPGAGPRASNMACSQAASHSRCWRHSRSGSDCTAHHCLNRLATSGLSTECSELRPRTKRIALLNVANCGHAQSV